MNPHEYKELISGFLNNIFSAKYIPVSLPFICIIVVVSCCTSSIYYKKKINDILLKNKKLPDVLELMYMENTNLDENQDKLNKYLDTFLSSSNNENKV
jgi:predicted membrane metal-binding protein